MIQITCKGNSAICTRTERLTSGMVGLQCEFVFDEAWDGLAKTAVFQAGSEKRDVLLQGAVCTVPWEVLKTAGYQLVIGVYGTNDEGTLVIPTVYAMCGGIASGADPGGDESTDPTLPVWGQMQGMIGNLADLATASKDNLVAAINEAAQSGGGGGASIELDTTLTQSGKAADAKAVGDALAEKQPKGDYITKNELPDMTAYRTAEAQDVIDAGKQDTLIQSGASVGQIAKITAVDDTGKPTAWQAVDMPNGGGGGSAQRVVVDTTLSDSASEIIIDRDSDGNVFRLREAHIVVELPANSENAETSTNVWIYPDSVGSNRLRMTGSVQNKTSERAIILNVFAIGNTAKNIIGSIGGNYAYAPNCIVDKLDDFFSYLRIQSRTTGNSFAAGTRIVIWGVDA